MHPGQSDLFRKSCLSGWNWRGRPNSGLQFIKQRVEHPAFDLALRQG